MTASSALGKNSICLLLPFNTNHCLAFTGNEQHLAGEPFHAGNKIDVDIAARIEWLLFTKW